MIGGIGPSGPYGFGRLNVRPPRSPFAAARGALGVDRRAALGRLTSYVMDLRHAFDGLARGTRVRSTGATAAAALAQSSAPLGLTTSTTAATLTSTAKLQSVATSYGPSAPEWTGLSTAPVEIGGTYDGSLGSDKLTYLSKDTGVLGVNDLHVDVLDGAGQTVDSVTFLKAEFQPGAPIPLESGLTIALGDGALVKGDTFSLNVTAEPGPFDPSQALDAGGLVDPVQSGNFQINGVKIALYAGDSLDDVMARITGSAAGVSAVYDAGTSRLTLIHSTLGPGTAIDLSNDSTGFFDAAHLSGATLVPGAESQLDAVLSSVPSLSGIQKGGFAINGTSIDVDPGADSLADVLARINDADLGVTASLDEASGKVRIAGADGASFSLDDGDSGLFTALGIAPGDYVGQELAKHQSFGDRGTARRTLGEFVRTLNAFFAADFDDQSTTRLQSKSARSRLESAVKGALAGIRDGAIGTRAHTSFGFAFDFSGDGELIQIDETKLDRALQGGSRELAAFLHGDGSDGGGLLERLKSALDSAGSNLLKSLDPADGIGLAIDLQA